MREHQVTYKLSKEERREIASVFQHLGIKDHIQACVVSFIYLFLSCLTYRMSRIFIVGINYISEYEAFFASYRPFLYFTSESLTTITLMLMGLLQAAFLVLFFYRSFSFYYYHYLSGRVSDTRKYCIISKIENNGLNFTVTVFDDTDKYLYSLEFTEKDIQKAASFKSGYIFLCSLKPVLEYNMSQKKALRKNSTLNKYFLNYNYFMINYVAKLKGSSIYFPLPESLSEKDQQLLSNILQDKK